MSDGAGAPRDPVAAQADAALRALGRAVPGDVVLGVFLYGSAVDGGLQPDSDLDLFGVLARRLGAVERRTLVEELVPISWRARRPSGWRPVELTLVVRDEVVPWRYPPRMDLQYGEWLRDELLAEGPDPGSEANPDLAVLLTIVRDTGRPLLGPPPSAILDRVPRADLVRAMRDGLPGLLDDLETDTRNVLLTLARMVMTIELGTVAPKDAAAAWAARRLPPEHAAVLERARAGYRGEVEDRWDDRGAASAAAGALAARIARGGEATSLPPADASV